MRGSVFRDSSFRQEDLFNTVTNLSPESRNNISRVQWKRIEEVFPQAVNWIFRKINPDDILPPRYFPDHTLWKVLKHLATKKHIINSLFIIRNDSGRGEYSLYIHKDGRSSEIRIDSTIPVIEEAPGKFVPAFINLNFSNGNIPDLWPVLVEKALAKAMNSLQMLFSRDFVEQYSLLCFDTIHKFYSDSNDGRAFERDIFDFQDVRSVEAGKRTGHRSAQQRPRPRPRRRHLAAHFLPSGQARVHPAEKHRPAAALQSHEVREREVHRSELQRRQPELHRDLEETGRLPAGVPLRLQPRHASSVPARLRSGVQEKEACPPGVVRS